MVGVAFSFHIVFVKYITATVTTLPEATTCRSLTLNKAIATNTIAPGVELTAIHLNPVQ
jgi:hypothetical protein